MKIGFDLAQASSSRAGCGWYAQSLLEAMADGDNAHDFLAYRHFARWLNPPKSLTPIPVSLQVRDPQINLAPQIVAEQWAHALNSGEFPDQPDLVHSTSFQAPRIKHAPLIFTLFDLSFWAVPDFTTDEIRVHCQRGVLDALENAAGLIFTSEHARGEFNRFLPQFRRQKKIATAVTPLASRWPVVAHPASGMGQYWLYVGSQEPRKNISGLLDAYERYLNEHANPLPLWLVGGVGWKNESWQPRLERLEERNLVRRLGYVPDEAMPDLYRRATALVFPSWYEGFGLPILEAMTQGCPVICSDRASMPEVGGDAVHYVNPAASASITDAMFKLEGDRLYRSSLIERGLRQAAKFSWKQTANLTLAFYEYVASSQAH